MSKYKFTESEQDDLKVAKYNKELGDKLLEEFKQLNAQFKNENDDNERFLTTVENKLGIRFSEDKYNPPSIVHSEPVLPDWEQLVEEAKVNIPFDVDYEDLLTSEEFASAYRHLDEINEQFAKKKRGLEKLIGYFWLQL